MFLLHVRNIGVPLTFSCSVLSHVWKQITKRHTNILFVDFCQHYVVGSEWILASIKIITYHITIIKTEFMHNVIVQWMTSADLPDDVSLRLKLHALRFTDMST